MTPASILEHEKTGDRYFASVLCFEHRPDRPYDEQTIARFIAKVEPLSSGCWNWRAALTPAGYGQFHLPRNRGPQRVIAAHRFAYLLVVGPIPDGLELDHLCRNRWCCNPTHVEPVTRRENMRRSPLRGAGAAARAEQQKAKTHCPQSHPYSGDNLYLTPRGYRRCRVCNRERARRRDS